MRRSPHRLVVGLLLILMPGSVIADSETGWSAPSTTVASPQSTTPPPSPSPSPTPPAESSNSASQRARPAATPPTPTVHPPVATDDLLRRYEIQLAAHRRELLQREAELDRANRRIAKLSAASPASRADVITRDPRVRDLERSREQARAEIAGLVERTRELESELEDTAAASPPPPAPTIPPAGEVMGTAEQAALIVSLRQDLDTERENRATLEKEIQRLFAESRSSERLEPISRSVESARAEILVLNHRLADEQRAREALEVVIERVRLAANADDEPDWLPRFEETMKRRRQQSERLQEELHKANEAIVVLRARLESNPPPPSTEADQQLSIENTKLRQAIEAAQQANAELHAQAELAARLAELLYGQPQ